MHRVVIQTKDCLSLTIQLTTFLCVSACVRWTRGLITAMMRPSIPAASSFVLWIKVECNSGTLSSVRLLCPETRCREWCLFTNPGARGHSRLSVRTQWYMGDEWSTNCIFHFVPLCLRPPSPSLHTHYTTGNTCNASRCDFWQRGGGNNFRKPALFLNPIPPPLHAPLSAAPTLLCQPSIWWLETTHFIAVTRHDGPVRPAFPDLFLALCSGTPLSGRQRVGRSPSILICHGWAAREALTPFSPGGFFISLGPVIRPQLHVRPRRYCILNGLVFIISLLH